MGVDIDGQFFPKIQDLLLVLFVLFGTSLRGGILSFALSSTLASSKPLILWVGEIPLIAVKESNSLKPKTADSILYNATEYTQQ